jgi:uncharacterized protein YbbK (DUF523 family)
MRILVSACLLGVGCRYDGAHKCAPGIEKLTSLCQLIPVCPEILGGLPTPRPPAERVGDRVLTREGKDVTAQYQRGAEEILRLAKLFSCTAALLKERSPACGCGQIYDGSFSRQLTQGNGVAAALLLENGIPVYGESQLDELLSTLR